jgi:hypothetical protein
VTGSSFSEGFFDEGDDSLAAIESMPRFGAGGTEDAARKWAVIFARILHHLDLNAHLSQCSIHFLALAERVGLVALSL